MGSVKKLTLALPEETIRKAKRYARRHRTSVSSLVARFFDCISQPEGGEVGKGDERGVLTESCVGLVRLPPGEKAEMIGEALAQKYSGGE